MCWVMKLVSQKTGLSLSIFDLTIFYNTRRIMEELFVYAILCSIGYDFSIEYRNVLDKLF